MKVKKFICGFCKDKKIPFISTRKGLRDHLAQHHMRAKELTNSGYGLVGEGPSQHKEYIKQRWWISEVFE